MIAYNSMPKNVVPMKYIRLTNTFNAKDELGNICWIDEFTEFENANPHEMATGAKFYALTTAERLYQRSPTEYETGGMEIKKITRIED